TTPEQKSHFDPKTSRKVSTLSTATSDTYQNSDGSYSRKVSSGRVNYQAAGGSWQPIDTTLVTRSDGRLHMGANAVDVSVGRKASPGRAKATALASLTMPSGQSVAYGLQDAAAVDAVVNGSTVTYPGILANTDLELTMSASALKETVVLNSPA